MTGFAGVSAGESFSLGVRRDGVVFAWGLNRYGQLGDGTTADRNRPVLVRGLANVRAVSAGAMHSLALLADGTVWAWGRNDTGMLGDGSTQQRLAPVQVAGLRDVVAISAGLEFSVALKRDGTVWTWGSGFLGELGIGSTPGTQVTPVQVQGIPSIYAIRQGWSHVVAIGRDSSIWFWGRGGTESAYGLPTQVAALQGSALREFAVGSHSYNIYALAADGAVYSWGFNSHGQLGNGYTNNRFSPTSMPGVSDVTAVAGYVHSEPVSDRRAGSRHGDC